MRMKIWVYLLWKTHHLHSDCFFLDLEEELVLKDWSVRVSGPSLYILGMVSSWTRRMRLVFVRGFACSKVRSRIR
jgi:hypothetical protein